MNRDSENRETDPVQESNASGSSVAAGLQILWGRLGKWKPVLGVVLALVVVAGVVWGMDWLGPSTADAGEISIIALQEDETGVDPQSVFLLKTENPVNARMVTDNLKLSPEFTYDLKKGDDGKEYKIIPREELTENTVYRLAFDPTGQEREDLSWAFQTRGKFRVIGQLPQNETSGVPIETGIEFTLSYEDYDLAAAQKYFSISPQVKGKLEKHKKTLVFVPQKLEPKTVYTVTLKKGMPLLNGKEELAQDSVIKFETASDQESPAFSFDIDYRLTEFTSSQAPAFAAYYDNNIQAPPLHIDVYRYPDHSSFIASLTKVDEIPGWSYWARMNYREDTKELDKVAGYDTEFQKADRYSSFAAFPEALPVGYYLAEFKAGEAVRQVWFQISDLAVYRTQNEHSTLFWANDLTNNSPAEEIKVLLGDRSLKVTGDEAGVVLTQENLFLASSGYVLLKSKDKEILVPLKTEREQWYKSIIIAQDYWKYLYLDREVYLPGDTVNYWGVLAARKGSQADLKEITLELRGQEYLRYGQYDNSPVLSESIAIDGNTFDGQVKLPVLKPGYYSLNIVSGDTVLTSRGFSVQTYQKPAYNLSIEPEKKTLLLGEKTRVKVKTAFFEGTPVPEVNLSYYAGNKQGKVTTDALGEAQIELIGEAPSDSYGLYNYRYISVTANLPEVGHIQANTGLIVFGSKVYLTGEAQAKGNTFDLKARLRHVDINGMKDDANFQMDEFIKGPVVNGAVKGQLWEEVWKKTEAGERYDFINKKVEKIYDYQRSERLIEEFSIQTGPDGYATYKGRIDPDKNYFVTLTAVDGEGRESRAKLYINPFFDMNSKYYYIQSSQGYQKYQPGDQVSLTMMENDRELAAAGGKVLFMQGQDRIESYVVTGDPVYKFEFTKESIPNVNVAGVYFHEGDYHIADQYAVLFNPENQALNVKIQSDKAEYRPGEQVKLEVVVTDAQKRPVKNVRVNLNLVDEALYALGDQEVNILERLYQDLYGLFMDTWQSHYYPELRGGAEKGGEGGLERKDFRDTVLFTTLETGADGRTTCEFTLPDNLTSWRVTYHALDSNMRAAGGTQQIPVRLPFFVDMSLGTDCLEGDSPVVILRGFGAKLRANENIAYKMTLVDPQGKTVSQTGQGKSFTPFDWTMPELEVGSYSLTVEATSGKHKDTLTREFTVVKSLQERTVSSHEVLSNGLVVKGGAVEPTQLVFCDYEKSQYLNGLYNLSWLNGGRLEQGLAGREAIKLIKQYFPEEKDYFEAGSAVTAIDYQRPDGGISILPYGSSDLALSARVAADYPDEIDRGALIGYFYKILEEDEQDVSLALLGLASLDEPVLNQIKQKIKEPKLAAETRINLAAALLEIGDGSEALKVYGELLNKNRQDLEDSIRINTGRDQDEILAATISMAQLAARLDQPEKNKLYQYILNNSGEEQIYYLEEIQILKELLRRMNPQPVSFSYELNGKKTNKNLKAGESFTMTVLPQDLSRIRFSQVEGKVGLTAKYSQAYLGDGSGSPDLSISRQYQVGDKTTNSLQRTDLVKVTITFKVGNKAPGRDYEVVDILPAGLRHISSPYDYGIDGSQLQWWSYPSEVKGTKLVFTVGRDAGKITYYARVASPGEFRAQAPIISNVASPAIFAQGAKERITIR
ncbi:MAG: alpha-2-macroglobulin [Syntrophomonadaceae bacterium]|nr:alpha-2-macroglobulin [Syntrophomonadaceae bacterium]